MPGLLRFLYRKLGRRYPRVVLAVQFQFAFVATAAGIAFLSLYQDMSLWDFLKLMIAVDILLAIENVVSLRFVFRMLRPADDWLRGDHRPSAAVRAWRTLADLPTEYLHRRKLTPVVSTALPWCVYATWELGLQWYSFFILLAGSGVTMLYGVAARYFLMDLSMRPILERISGDLPADFELPRGVPLRWKLLVGLPVINIITAVTVSGLSTDGTAKLSDLGLDVLVAVAVAVTISLELTVLLSRSLVGPLTQLQAATRRVARGDLSVRVPVISTDETGALAQSFNAAIAGLQERERLREAFGSYVDPDIAERILEHGAVLEGDEVEVSILFLDIRDFTAFAERSSAREVVQALNDFWERVVPILVKHGGHANKFIGDGLLGVFGAPYRVDDHADRAVAAALEITELLRDHYGGRLRAGIGVNSGPVVAGTIGGGGRLEFTVIGDAVNTAARVEQCTRTTDEDVLVTEATRCLLERDHCGFEELPDTQLRGKTEHVRLYAPRVEVRAGDTAEAVSAVD
jgi:class 3 adenylate cyclase